MSFIFTAAMMDLTAGDDEKITISGTSVGFTSTKIKPTSGKFKDRKCKGVVVFVYDYPIYWTVSGNDADSDKPIAYPGQNIPIRNEYNVENFRAIRESADATIKVIYFW